MKHTYEPPHYKTNKVAVHPAKSQISLGILVWSESSLCTKWVAKDPSFFNADSEDSDRWAHSYFVGCFTNSFPWIINDCRKKKKNLVQILEKNIEKKIWTYCG